MIARPREVAPRSLGMGERLDCGLYGQKDGPSMSIEIRIIFLFCWDQVKAFRNSPQAFSRLGPLVRRRGEIQPGPLPA